MRRLTEYLGVLLLAILAALVVYQGIEKAVKSSIDQTAEQIRKAGR
jgi:hypothetical protein